MSPGIVTESDLSGNLQSEYVFFDVKRVARKDFPGGTVSYYFSDGLKTASVITDSAGNIKSDSAGSRESEVDIYTSRLATDASSPRLEIRLKTHTPNLAGVCAFSIST